MGRTTRPRATLRDIAETTGFSTNTVSLALHGSPRLPDETRGVILREAVRLARSLASNTSNTSHTIGLLMTDILNPTLTLAAHTIERELSAAGYAVMFAASGGSVETERRALDLF